MIQWGPSGLSMARQFSAFGLNAKGPLAQVWKINAAGAAAAAHRFLKYRIPIVLRNVIK